MKFFEYLLKIDRRIIYIVMGVLVIIPLVKPLGLGVSSGPRAKTLFDAVDSIPAGKTLLLSVDFDPSSMPELYPMLAALMRHAFAKDVKVLLCGLWVTGAGLADKAVTEIPPEYGKKYGDDVVYLGWKAGIDAVILGMGENIRNVFPTDYYGHPLESLAMMQSVQRLRDIPMAVAISAGTPGYTDWLNFAQSRYGLKLGAGVTAVSAADAYPYLQTGQLTGLLAGMKGGAEYEVLIQKNEYSKAYMPAVAAMDSQSLAHVVILLLVIIGNVAYFATRKRGA
ncbi:hypothetical protein FJY68_08805 [candidate division WOR-3 bacterium]|uniref:Uncharacterized protein n=1 Tax=candidate division WOR-3 bacterium TaxID=2052148 RepID=A0A938BQ88_UNCW3|nr:hypothetical protein [candidate division WOR-3 bacterium]